MEKKLLKKILVMAIVFVITFSNCGLTLQAFASSEGLSIFGFSLFEKSKMSYKAYFLDENGKEIDEMSANINQDMTLVLELEPKEIGYLKTGTIRAVADEGNINFEFKEVENVIEKEEESKGLQQVVQLEETLLKTSQEVNANLPEVELNVMDNSIFNTTLNTENANVVSNSVAENTVANEVPNANTVDTNTVNTVVESTNTITNEVPETSVTPNDLEESDELVNEETVYEEEVKQNIESEIKPFAASSAKILNSDELLVENIVEKTKIYVKISYVQSETIKASDLYKEISFELNGTFINKDLEEVEITYEDEIMLEWTYSKDIIVSSEITKVSPFEVEGTKGTLVESKIVVNRTIDDEKYLPLKETVIELEAPKINGNAPINLDVRANKLKATVGEEINEITFSNSNWNYDTERNIITIKVENPEGVLTNGEDVYVIAYRYADYVESEEITVNLKGKVTVEEYTGKSNNRIEKELSDSKTAIVNIGELITYSIGTTEEPINRAKINANYNSVEAVYETEFVSTIDINILTNDVLKEFTLKDIKEFYIDKSNIEFEAKDVKYKTIRFKYDEIIEMLNIGGTIEIRSNTGEVLHTLSKETVTSAENCEIVLNNVNGIEISVRNIEINGTITVDIVKSIGKCSYEKFAFNNFEKIESRVKAEVKYGKSDEIIELPAIKTEKYFEKSYTKAEIIMNTESLSTILDNENVEIKIELNNNDEKSDLYINPQFEVVFPSYVENIEVKSVNLLYEEGLAVKGISLFKDSNNVQRMRIELEGVQREFSSSDITNGTNIIVNTKIMVDDYTPRKTEQIKMYYFNQGVTNYQSQTDWKISVPIPEGIIKTTNGFDVEVFEFQAPAGFITANGIENYDGFGSKIDTVKQGEITAKVEMNETARPVVMNLAALNNTGNICTDVAMLGRIPTKDTIDVITGNKLNTNMNAILLSKIEQSSLNSIGCDIYYSTKADANKNLNDGYNAWNKDPGDMSNIKSFLIIPTAKMEPGTLLKFSYVFQVPANLPYDVEMYSSFGSFYNNHSDIAVMYESSKADLVGLFTDKGPKVDVSLSVDVGDGTDIGETRYMKYILSIANTGSEDLEYITAKLPKPDYVTICERVSNNGFGNNNYEERDTKEKVWNISKLVPGESVTKEMYVKVSKIPSEYEFYANLYNKKIYKDENGYYYEKVIEATDTTIDTTSQISETEQELLNEEEEKENETVNPNEKREKVYVNDPVEVSINAQASVMINNLNGEIRSNETKNKVIESNFDIKVNTETISPILLGSKFKYMSSIKNISGKEQKNVNVSIVLPETVKYIDTEVYTYSHENPYNKDNVKYDEATRTVTFTFPEIYQDEIIAAYVRTEVIKGENSEVSTAYLVTTEDGKIEKSSNIDRIYAGAVLEISQKTNLAGASVLEGEGIEIVITVENKGNYVAKNVLLEDEISENLEKAKIKITGNISDSISVGEDRKISKVIGDIPANGKAIIKLTGVASKLDGTEKNISNRAEISADMIEKQSTDVINIGIKKNPNMIEEPIYEMNNKSEQENTNNNNNNNANNPVEHNTNSNLQNQNTQNNNNNNQDNVNKENTVSNKSIKGYVWLDANKNSRKDENESGIEAIEVRLYQNNKVQKTTTTNSNGEYTFSNVNSGNYSVMFVYDSDKYITASYKEMNVEEDLNSDASSITKGSAVTNKFAVTDLSIENLNLGLQEKNRVDFEINKYITKAIVKTKNKEETHNYEDLKLGKIDIKARELNKSSVKFEYKIVVENKGNVIGKIGTIIDYIPSGLMFDVDSNREWAVGENGAVYSNALKDKELAVGEKTELILILTKNMNEKNTGVIVNKVIGNFENDVDDTNNSSTQEMIVTVSTGKAQNVIFIFIIIIMIMTFLIKYQMKNGKIKLKFNKKFQRVYR